MGKLKITSTILCIKTAFNFDIFGATGVLARRSCGDETSQGDMEQSEHLCDVLKTFKHKTQLCLFENIAEK